jgi:hypothetical protein
MHAVTVAMIAASAWMILVPPFAMIREAVSLPSAAISWLMAVSLLWVIAATSIALAVLGRTAARKNDPSRRLLLANTITALAVAPVAAAAAGIASARRIETVQRDIVLPGLPKDLHGLRIAQLTDIHYGPFFGAQDLRRAIAIANEWNPHLTVVTGDLITRRGDDLERCIQLLAGLRAEAGVFGCHGNHEMYSGA